MTFLDKFFESPKYPIAGVTSSLPKKPDMSIAAVIDKEKIVDLLRIKDGVKVARYSCDAYPALGHDSIYIELQLDHSKFQKESK